VCRSFVTRLAFHVVGDSLGQPNLLGVALGAERTLGDLAQVEAMGLVAICADRLRGVEGALALGIVVAARAPEREL
jgi:hypothetical protein